MVRCLNIDWLECFAREDVVERPTAQFFMARGFDVEIRPFGTRVYKSMFVIKDEHRRPIIEVRRDPFSAGESGIFKGDECHIRLTNYACYFANPCEFLRVFLEKFRYNDIRISRVDICLDFVKFDSGDMPAKFVRRFMKGVYSKINQANIRAFGKDGWDGKQWNSLSWGSASSPIYTKLYCKTLELRNLNGTWRKPWIPYQWFLAGLVDDPLTCSFKGEEQSVWRLEFTVKSAVKGWVTIDKFGSQKKHSIRNNLDTWASKANMLFIFAILVQHYFSFRKYKEGVSKFKCEEKRLFIFDQPQEIYSVMKKNFDDITIRPRDEDMHVDFHFLSKLADQVAQYRKLFCDITTKSSAEAFLDEINRVAWVDIMAAFIESEDLKDIISNVDIEKLPNLVEKVSVEDDLQNLFNKSAKSLWDRPRKFAVQ